MAIVSSMPPMLSLGRSSQSGAKTMTAAWQVLFTDNTTSSAIAFLFGSAEIDLTNMQAGDVINIRVRKTLVPGGAWVLHDQMSYSGAQPATHPSAHIGGLLNVYGVEISAQQVGGVLRTINTDFYLAKRLGLS